MACHVAQRARPEIPEPAPVPGRVGGIVGTLFGRAYEQIPVQRGRDGNSPPGLGQSLRPDGAVRPAVGFVDIPDDT
ncbi:hypothetical protein SDC9_109185 [bioreactor metagenome]|uniref:Uncharacterized protein n=1 Tax=bioreactor metagenome TaxID=1076179 RepID=A0A645BA18_9ZZZZ